MSGETQAGYMCVCVCEGVSVWKRQLLQVCTHVPWLPPDTAASGRQNLFRRGDGDANLRAVPPVGQSIYCLVLPVGVCKPV